MTVKQILDAESPDQSEFRIDGAHVSQVTLVGQIRRLNSATTNLKIDLDDGTGTMEVRKYVEPEKQEEAAAGLELDAWVRVYGSCKTFNSKHFISARLIRPVANYNEVSYHMLEASFVHLYNTRGVPGGASKPAPGAAGGGGGGNDSMFVDGGGGDAGYNAGGGGNQPKLAGAPPEARKMYNFLEHQPNGSDGINIKVIEQGTGMVMGTILKAADHLLGQGLIYTTVDDEHWAILEY